MSNSKPATPLPNPLPDPADHILRQLAAGHSRIIDVRAPAEFRQGALPNSINLPILNDAERARVGTTYKQSGPRAAVQVGHELVSGATREQRISGWARAASPGSLIMCWRGGQRSQIAQSWLQQRGIQISRVQGGYKALRRHCLQVLQHTAAQRQWYVLAGCTGVGKTVLLNTLPHSIDLEARAEHRGSAFGGDVERQPSQATFENRLACDSLMHRYQQLVVEDESRTIGRAALPESWARRMQSAPLVVLEADLESRVEHIYNEYVVQPLAAQVDNTHLYHHYSTALQRISRRLGGVRYKRINSLLAEAFSSNSGATPPQAHRGWISALLTEYYDPMYHYQLDKKQPRICFSGSREAVQAYLNARCEPLPD